MEIYIREGRSLSGRERNVLFLNVDDPKRRFSDISALSGLDQDGDGRGVGLSDWDADGDLDVWISNRTAPTVQVFENEWGSRAGDFLALSLEGTKSNRDAAGARATVLLKGQEKAPLLRTVRLGEGFQSQSSKRLHFGIGKGAEVASVTVRWPGPDYEVEEFAGVASNGFYFLKQGTGQAEEAKPTAGKFKLPPGPSIAKESEEEGSGIFLPFRQLFPVLKYRDLPSGKEKVGGQSGKPTLLILWHPECMSCFWELEDLADNAERVKSWNIECLATTMEPGEGDDPKLAAEVIAKTKFPFEVGFTEGPMVERILALHRHLFYRPYQLETPTSFLLDAKGRLVAVYRGELNLNAVEGHLKTLGWPAEKVAAESNLFAGTSLAEPLGLRPSVLIKVYIENQMPDEAERIYRHHATHKSVADQVGEVVGTIGQSYMVLGDYPNAKRLLIETIKHSPKDARSRNNLAAVYLKEGDSAEAMRLWQESCDLDASLSAPRLNLGKQLMKQKRTVEAMTILRQFIVLEPNSADGHNYLSMGYLRTRDFLTAEQHLKRLIELRPSDGGAYANLATVYLALRDKISAMTIIEQGIAAEGVDPRSRQQLQLLKQRL